MDFEELDYYELLGVERSASTDEIKRAFRREIVKYHPDRFTNAPPEEQAYAQRRAQLLTEAQSVLTDFQSRNAYNRGQPLPRRSGSAPRPATGPRDHQAELYDQAQEHIAAGRWLQAIAALRQLQQINPLYRDAAQLVAHAEAKLQSEQPSAEPIAPERRRFPLIAAAAVGALALLGGAALWLSLPSGPQTVSIPPTLPPLPATAIATTVPAFADPPTITPPPTEEPTAEATAVPTAAPTLAPSPLPTVAPTAALGTVLRSDDFSAEGWADGSGNGWTVGYDGGRYRITAVSGAGTIWSYRTGPIGDYALSADVQAAQGAGGVMVRFDGETRSYVAFLVNPADGSYRLETHRGPSTTLLLSGTSGAILRRADDTNRLEIVQRADRADLLVNGTLLQTVDLSTAPTGRDFGLVAAADKSAADVSFDNLEIRAVVP